MKVVYGNLVYAAFTP
ncbi:hypothetical protein Q5N41_10620 [Vibrio cholerae]|nr:hypothetical protein [Vibrio cholerae]